MEISSNKFKKGKIEGGVEGDSSASGAMIDSSSAFSMLENAPINVLYADREGTIRKTFTHFGG
jgi:hypothetical protein